MSFKAKISIDGTDYNVLHCNFSLHQEVDATGRPSSITRGGNISVVIESTDSTALFEWMCDNYMRKDGTITFNKRDEDAKLKELKFTEAYLVAYEESFDHTGTGAMITSFTMSAREINMGNGVHINEWV
jgi:hypothetical protein